MTETTDRRTLLTTLGAGLAGFAFWSARPRPAEAAERFPVQLSDAEWRRKLPGQAYDVLRHEATERPYSSPLNGEHRAGTFHCRGCNQPLYSSKTKFESGTGWPSFWAPLNGAVATKTDRSMFMARTEVHCSRCGGHQGHVFNDGPRPTGKRYCMNGASMTFTPA